jgi:hypothetical protein
MVDVAKERMNVITEQNFGDVYPEEVRERYWRTVERSLKEIFGESPDAARRYRQLVDNDETPVAEQILVYHQEPLNVAADLAGIKEVTVFHQEKYREICGSEEPAHFGIPSY